MATVNWEAPSTWADAFQQSNLNAAANNGGVLSTATAVANGTGLDLYADISVRLASITPAAGGHIAFYLLPLFDDGSTYADGTTSTTATSLATPTHFAGSLALRAVASAQNGMVRGVVLPPGTFKFYLVNRSGVALGSGATANTIKYRAYGETVGVVSGPTPGPNLITTQDLTNAAWTKFDLTASNATTLLETATTAQHSTRQTVTVVAAVNTYRVTMDLLPVGARYAAIYVQTTDFANRGYAEFNLSGGTVIDSGGTGTSTIANVSIVSQGGGVFRCGFDVTTDGSATSLYVYLNVLSNTGVYSYLGTTSTGMTATNIQLYDVAV